jgi:hypothetical protein
VLTWLAGGLLGAAAVLAGRWVLRPIDGLGRRVRFPLVSVLLLVVLGGGLLIPVVRHHRLEARLSAVASELTGVPVRVHCQTAGQELVDLGSELGWVRYDADGVPEHETLIKRAPCSQLAGYLAADQSAPSLDEVVAVHVLSHESRHMAGSTSEAVAECEAMQRDARAAELLGADPAEAAELARAYWNRVYPQMGDDYVSGDCRPGGALDERLPSAPWLAPTS